MFYNHTYAPLLNSIWSVAVSRLFLFTLPSFFCVFSTCSARCRLVTKRCPTISLLCLALFYPFLSCDKNLDSVILTLIQYITSLTVMLMLNLSSDISKNKDTDAFLCRLRLCWFAIVFRHPFPRKNGILAFFTRVVGKIIREKKCFKIDLWENIPKWILLEIKL